MILAKEKRNWALFTDPIGTKVQALTFLFFFFSLLTHKTNSRKVYFLLLFFPSAFVFFRLSNSGALSQRTQWLVSER